MLNLTAAETHLLRQLVQLLDDVACDRLNAGQTATFCFVGTN